MPFNVDLHNHSFFSSDGLSSPEEMISVAKAKGLHALAITDHDNCESADYLYERGLMREDGMPVDDFLLIPGVEVSTSQGHLLCLGAVVAESWKGAPAEDVCRAIHEAGGLAVPPHPFDRFRSGIRETVLETLPIDAVEVFNAATTFDRHNRRAMKYARTKGCGMLASSDAHHADAVGTAYSVLEMEELSLKALLEAIPKATVTVERYQSIRDSVRKAMANLRRLAR